MSKAGVLKWWVGAHNWVVFRGSQVFNRKHFLQYLSAEKLPEFVEMTSAKFICFYYDYELVWRKIKYFNTFKLQTVYVRWKKYCIAPCHPEFKVAGPEAVPVENQKDVLTYRYICYDFKWRILNCILGIILFCRSRKKGWILKIFVIWSTNLLNWIWVNGLLFQSK